MLTSVLTKRGNVRNALYSFLVQAAPVIAALISMPFLNRFLGVERIGILSLILVIVGYGSMLDLGMSRAVTKVAAEALGRHEESRIPQIFWNAVFLQTMMALVGSCALILAAPLLVTKILHVPVELQQEARTSLMIASVAIPILLVTLSSIGLLQAAQRFDLTAGIQVPLSIANSLIPVLFALWWHSVTVVVIVFVTMRAIAGVLLFRQAIKVFPTLFDWHRYDKHELLGLLSFGGWISVSSLISPLLTNTDRFLVSNRLSVSAVAYYSVPYDMMIRLLIIPTSIATALFPVFSADGPIASRQLALRAMRTIALLMSIPALLIVCFGDTLMALWMGPAFAAHSSTVLRIMAVGVVANGLATIPYAYLQANGRPDITVKIHLAELPIHLGFVWCGATYWGITGVALAWASRVFLDAVLLCLAAYVFQKKAVAATTVTTSAQHPEVECLPVG